MVIFASYVVRPNGKSATLKTYSGLSPQGRPGEGLKRSHRGGTSCHLFGACLRPLPRPSAGPRHQGPEKVPTCPRWAVISRAAPPTRLVCTRQLTRPVRRRRAGRRLPPALVTTYAVAAGLWQTGDAGRRPGTGQVPDRAGPPRRRPRPPREVWAAAQGQGLSEHTLRRARKELAIRSRKVWRGDEQNNYWLLRGQTLAGVVPHGEDLDAWDRCVAEVEKKYPPLSAFEDED